MIRRVLALAIVLAAPAAQADEDSPIARSDAKGFVIGWHTGYPEKDRFDAARLAGGKLTALPAVRLPARWGCRGAEALPEPPPSKKPADVQSTAHMAACGGKRGLEVWIETDYRELRYRVLAKPDGGAEIELAKLAATDRAKGYRAGMTPVVAWDGTQYLVVWQDLSEGGWVQTIWAMRIDDAGRALDRAPNLVSGEMFAAYAPVVAAGPSGWLVAWQHGETGVRNAIRAARVDVHGQVLDAEPLRVSADGRWPALAFDGTDWVVAFEADRGKRGLYAARVATDGKVRDPGGVALLVDERLGNGPPGLAFGGGGSGVLAHVELDAQKHTKVEVLALDPGLKSGATYRH